MQGKDKMTLETEGTSSTSFSILVEWENVLLSGESRANKMLSSVINQANLLKNCCEIIVSANTDQPELKERPKGLNKNIEWILIVNTGLHYYQLKDEAARHAKSEVIVFVDSDVLPDKDWLKNLTDSFRNPNIQASCGKAYIDYYNLYTKAFALFWFFPTKNHHPSRPRRTTNHFFANNVAFKKKLFLQYYFGKNAQVSRGGCLALGESLRRDGIDIYLCENAFVAHPPPQLGSHFILRALAQGRDRLLRNKPCQRHIGYSIYRLFKNSAKSFAKITLRHRSVELPLVFIPAAIAIGQIYYFTYFLGEVFTLFSFKPVLRISI